MSRQIFATVSPTGITIRAALPGEVYGDPMPFSAALLWMRSVTDGATMPEEPAE
jgi:hypothetical protein